MADKVEVIGESERYELLRVGDVVTVRPKGSQSNGRWECSWQHFTYNRAAYEGVGHNFVLTPAAYPDTVIGAAYIKERDRLAREGSSTGGYEDQGSGRA